MSRPTPSNAPTTTPSSNVMPRSLSNRISHVDLTKDLLRTYDRVQAHIYELELENQRLRALVEATDAVPTSSAVQAQERPDADPMTDKVTGIGRSDVPSSTDTGALVWRDAETELSCLSSLLVASNWIHGTLTVIGVHRRLKDILEQLVGAQAYVVYILNEQTLSAIAAEGLRPEEDARFPPRVALDVAHTGVSHISASVQSTTMLQDPVAAIPLKTDQRLVGVLLIVRLLPHKGSLNDTDYEMFQFLGQHAASALVAAGLYAQAGQRLPPADVYHPAPQRG